MAFNRGGGYDVQGPQTRVVGRQGEGEGQEYLWKKSVDVPPHTHNAKSIRKSVNILARRDKFYDEYLQFASSPRGLQPSPRLSLAAPLSSLPE